MPGPEDDLPVRVLSLRQPWPWAIFEPEVDKDRECRSWKPGRPYRLLIHAGLRIDYAAVEYLTGLGYAVPDELAVGAIIGRTDTLDWEWGASRVKLRSVWALRGQWNWHLTNKVRAKRPLVCKGQQGLFFPPDRWQDSFPVPRRSERKGKCQQDE